MPFWVESNIIGMIIGFYVFMGATFGVLNGMSFLECCLHTLRLHWVEFQNKFYKGGGVAYEPVKIEKVIKGSQ